MASSVVSHTDSSPIGCRLSRGECPSCLHLATRPGSLRVTAHCAQHPWAPRMGQTLGGSHVSPRSAGDCSVRGRSFVHRLRTMPRCVCNFLTKAMWHSFQNTHRLLTPISQVSYKVPFWNTFQAIFVSPKGIWGNFVNPSLNFSLKFRYSSSQLRSSQVPVHAST